MRRLYEWRLTNWLMANPLRWRYDRIYASARRGSKYHPPEGRLRSAWLALTFPHVHAPWED